MRPPAILCVICLTLFVQNASHSTRITWDDLASLHRQLESRGISTTSFDSYVDRVRSENAARVRAGDLDHLIFYALQSTHFTSLAPIEPALSAKALVDSGRVPENVARRIAALVKALDSPPRDPRLVYFRALVQAAFPNRGGREAGVLAEYRRVMTFIYDKEFVAQKAGPDAVAELYRRRGLSTDTAVEAGYVVYTGLGIAKSLEPERRIRRVLIVGPGLDLAPRTSFVEMGPPESYQPWAVIDALVSLGLSRLDDLTVVGADINPRVVDRLRRSHDAAPALTLVSGIAESVALKFSPDYREYFAQLGRSIGEVKDVAPPRGLEGRLAKTVRVRPDAARALHAELLDVVTERLDDAAPFDLVIATNILPYFDDAQLTMAMSNIGAMLAPGGIFLHNEARPLLGEITAALGFPFEQSRQVVIANASGGAAPLVDSLFTHRKAAPASRSSPLGFSFTNIAQSAGLTARTVYGKQGTSTYLFETTGTGAAAFDYDGDGWTDIFLVNGSTLERSPPGEEPTNHLYRNRGNGTFEDVTSAAGLAQSGWGQASCVGDYDNDGHDDLFVTYWGQNHLYRNKGDGTFEDVTARAGLTQPRRRWNTGCAFLDYDRDGRLDLFAANYIDLDLSATPTPEAGLCRYKGLPVACGPPGLPGGKNLLYHNRGDGTFADVSEPSGITRAAGTYALGVATLDFDDDGWTDLFVANDSNPSALYRNNHDGTFTDIAIRSGCAYSQDGRAQSGMGLAIGDYDRNGTMDIFKTNFAGDTSTLYANTGESSCDDRTFVAGIGVNTRWLGWGVGFVDLDGDGWLDLFLVNGHVYPEVDRLKSEAGYKQRKVVYRNLRNGRFADVSEQLGPPITTPKAGRGAAFADFDNDGDVDVVVNNVHDTPDLFRLDRTDPVHWTGVKLVGRQSNRDAIGALVRVITADGEQRQEVRGGGSYYSQNDFRVHFGLGRATAIDRIIVRWPNGLQEYWIGLGIDRLHTLIEGTGTR